MEAIVVESSGAQLLREITELARAARMPQAAQRLALDLADALARQPELLPDFFQRVRAAVLQAEAQPQNARLASGQRAEHFLNLFAQEVLVGDLRGGRCGEVFDKAAELAVFLFPDRALEAHGAP